MEVGYLEQRAAFVAATLAKRHCFDAGTVANPTAIKARPIRMRQLGENVRPVGSELAMSTARNDV